MKAFSIIVTGGSSGIGLEAVRSIASREPKATIIVASRDVSKIEHAVQSVRNETGADVRGLELDLASFESVRSFVAKFRLLKAPPLRDLICNAGVNMTEFKTSADGFDQCFQGNYLGHFLLSHLLSRDLVENGGRIVNVASGTHDPGNPLVSFMRIPPPVFTEAKYLKDPQSAPEGMAPSVPFSNYATSKLSQIMSTFELQRAIESLTLPISVVAYDPGLNGGTSLGRDFNWVLRLLSPLMVRLMKWKFPDEVTTPEQSGPWLADLVLEKRNLTGVYVQCDKVIPTSQEAHNREKQRDLWNTSVKWLKLTEKDTVLPLKV